MHLGGLTNLSTLDLGWTPVTDAELMQLARLTNLSVLGLGFTNISDARAHPPQGAVEAVATFPDQYSGHRRRSRASKATAKSRALNLSMTPVTDAGADELKRVCPAW